MSTQAPPLRFGTDGWRDCIAQGFTLANVRRVADAAARHFLNVRHQLPVRNKSRICIAYDNRFLSPESAAETARIFSRYGFEVLMPDCPLPTPVLSFAIVHRKAAGGMMITASHNPFYFNGCKVKTFHGASAGSDETSIIEHHIRPVVVRPENSPKKLVRTDDFMSPYGESLRKKVNSSVMSLFKQTIIVDGMHGPGAHVFGNILNEFAIKNILIRDKRDPLFGSVNPEPIEKNLSMLKKAVRMHSNSIGIAFDGDADRIGMVDERGRFVNSHSIFSLLVLHVIKNKALKGSIIKTVSGTYMVERLAKKYSRSLIETPIGFKHITDQMLKGGVMIGGEESGGIGFAGHIPERDALLSALYMIELIAAEKKPLHRLIDDLQRSVGPSCYDRMDVKIGSIQDKDLFNDNVKTKAAQVFKKDPPLINDHDGVKFIWPDQRWLLLRVSGTEPVLRIYAESSSRKETDKLLALGKQFEYNQ
ncbi:MAG: phosphoglucomutase/phosphomannomutase family protein [Elusimicrobia bacterium]|nr:phosphoglucomutase/phosphomannomutase family protein [Elusimicrobiota bacterium]MBD3411657.1 phosphoglucomutase/phosphomannomutase family protein [Elusimicrobiota bacterium]